MTTGSQDGAPPRLNGNTVRAARSESGRAPRTSRRALVAGVGIVTVLVAAIAIAGGGGAGSSEDPANSGDGASGILSTEPARSTQGAQRAAVAIASAIGSEDMFTPETRHRLVRRIAHPDVETKLQTEYDSAYTTQFLKRIGLGPDGTPPPGTQFVSRTMPAGTSITEHTGTSAVVTVWASGVLDLTGSGPEAAKEAVSESWFTMTVSLRWHRDEWRLISTDQTSGPTPEKAAPGQFGQAPPL